MSIPRSLRRPADVARSTVETDRGAFAALEAGAATAYRRPVVLVPGYTGSKEDFLAVLAPMAAAGHHAVAIDLRGQYETPGPDDADAYELAELAADVLAVVAAVGGTAHLVGHSFGGFVTRAAAHAAAADPAGALPDARSLPAVASLVLMDSGPGEVTGTTTRTHLTMLAGALPQYDLETIWLAKRALERGAGAPEPPPEIEDFLHRRFVTTHPIGLTVAAAQLVAADDRASALADLDLPVLVLYGDAEDVWAPAELAAMAERIGARSHVVTGTGHSPAVDDPESTAQAMTEFWREVEG